jgi:hypothetical protein
MLKITVGKYNEANQFLKMIGGCNEFEKSYPKVLQQQ